MTSAGLTSNTASQVELLEEFRGREYGELFEALRRDPRINVGFDRSEAPRPDAIRNPYFPTPDAELYGAMLLRWKPHLVTEVGSGFSTAVARVAIDRGGLDCVLRVIDPEPRISVDDLADDVERVPVERSSLVGAGVPEHSLLFIDSSHVVRSGGDAPFLYCELLPSLPPNVLVHVHDVFLPYDYPPVYVRRGYNEQYLLHALLANNHLLEVLFATHLMAREHRPLMRSVFGSQVGDGPFGGASFWFRSTGS